MEVRSEMQLLPCCPAATLPCCPRIAPRASRLAHRALTRAPRPRRSKMPPTKAAPQKCRAGTSCSQRCRLCGFLLPPKPPPFQTPSSRLPYPFHVDWDRCHSSPTSRLACRVSTTFVRLAWADAASTLPTAAPVLDQSTAWVLISCMAKARGHPPDSTVRHPAST